VHDDLAEETVELAGREVTLLRPPSADDLIDEAAFDEDEFLPYWVELLRGNAERNGIGLRAERVRWDEPGLLLAEAPWDVVLGADLLYERRNADLLLELLPQLGPGVLLADPGRPFAKGFLEQALERWEVETKGSGSVKLHRLRLR